MGARGERVGGVASHQAGGSVGRFSGVELRCCFSWGSGFWEDFCWGNWSNQTEPQLKQTPCLAGCKNAKLGVCV